jgi:hypothetical protein
MAFSAREMFASGAMTSRELNEIIAADLTYRSAHAEELHVAELGVIRDTCGFLLV